MLSQTRVPILRQPYAQTQRGRQFISPLPACPTSQCLSSLLLSSTHGKLVASLWLDWLMGSTPDTDHMKMGQQAFQGWSPQQTLLLLLKVARPLEPM